MVFFEPQIITDEKLITLKNRSNGNSESPLVPLTSKGETTVKAEAIIRKQGTENRELKKQQ